MSISESLKKAYAEGRHSRSMPGNPDSLNEYYKTHKRGESLKKYWASKPVIVKSEETLKRMSIAAKKRWTDGVYKNKKVVGPSKLIGLKKSDEVKKKMSEAQKRIWKDRELRFSDNVRINMSDSHKGKSHWIGRKHSIESREKMKITNKGKAKSGWRMDDAQKLNVSISHAKGFRKVAGNIGPYKGVFFRSNWELGVARWLDLNNHKWEYEPKYFVLKNKMCYIPDFLVDDIKWLEVKGLYRKKDYEKMNAFVDDGNILFVVDERNFKHPDLYLSLSWRGVCFG